MHNPTRDPVVVVSATRTPHGAFMGELLPCSAHRLGAATMAATLERASLAAEHVDEVLLGCVLPAGQGQAPARQAALAAGLPLAAGCTTINKMCGSGMQAAILAHDALLAGSATVAIAGGMESMSNAPYLLPKARQGLRKGHAQMLDHLFLDGLEDAYQTGRLMGCFAEDAAAHYRIGRAAQDAFALESRRRASHAAATGGFDAELAPVEVVERTTPRLIRTDEALTRAANVDIASSKPAFSVDGSVTAGNASSIADGAASLLLMRRSTAAKHGLTALAEVLGHHRYAAEPGWFTTAPIHAIRGLLEKLALTTDQIGLYEINEAFALVPMLAIEQLTLPAERVNVHGGASALGHPIGASGARIIATLLHAMHRHGESLGVAAVCIGGGEATAMAFARPIELA